MPEPVLADLERADFGRIAAFVPEACAGGRA
ncbi:hypothetical protein ABID37_002394 [Aquamicrobium terrae]|uniref:Uncharacterized protein n=1 Tax=Aquamicrobium terrae TaxID=1324945 RepID=A0ABV2N094_9HYPH